MALSKTQVSQLYVSIFGRASEGSGNTYWQADASSMTDAANKMLATSAAATYFGTSLDDNAAFIKHIYLNTLGKTYAQDTGGVNYWVGELAAGKSRGEVVAALIEAAQLPVNAGAAQDMFKNKVAVSDYTADNIATANVADLSAFTGYISNVTSDVATVTAAKAKIAVAAEPVNPESIELTSGTDKGGIFNGTDGKDFFDASIAQNSFTGGVSNTLSSADKLDGGKGTDTLHAEIVPEFFGATGDNQIDIQPQTKDIEIVTFEARDSGANDGGANTLVTVDAKYMYGVEKIGSKFSDGDLVIENLTTLADNGTTIRNTSDMTITMDHTDDTDSDGHASNLTVLFDEDYLVTGQQTADATLTIRLLNAVQNEAGNNSVEGFSAITFKVGTKEVTVDITSVAKDATQDFTTAYDAIVDLINAELVKQGITTVTASISTLSNAVFSIPVAGFDVGDPAGQYYPITLTNSGSEELSGVEIASSKLSYDTDMNGSFTKTAPVTEEVPLSVKIELEKVGRDGEGGNLIVGAKGLDSTNAGNTDVDLTDGINQFNITVKGDVNKPSNLGVIQSTNNHLTTVNISSETRTDSSYAALTVRGQAATAVQSVFNTDGERPFGGTLDTLNADDFKGDLRIGEVTAAFNIDKFTAMGGGDIYLNELIAKNASITTPGSFASLDANEFTIDTAGGADEIIVDANSGAQLDVNTGAGADKITVSIDGQDDSGSDLTFATIVSGDGNDEVTVTSTDSTHDAIIKTGAGNDIIKGNSVNIDVHTGAGNDVIYAENTGLKATAVLSAGTEKTAFGTTTMSANAVDNIELLYGQTVRVTLNGLDEAGLDAVPFKDGFEATAKIVATNGYLTTELDLYTAIAKAINTDAVLSKLAEATIDSNGHLTVKSLIDGSTITGNDFVQFTILDNDWATGLSNIERDGITAALRVEYKDSDIGVTVGTDVSAAYNNAAIRTGVIETAGATAGTAAIHTIALADLTAAAIAAEDVTYTVMVNGTSVNFTVSVDPGADSTQTAAEQVAGITAAGPITVTANGIVYNVTAAGTDLVLTATTNTAETTGSAFLNATNVNASTFSSSQLIPTQAGVAPVGAGTDSTSTANNVVNGELGDDVIVLSSYKTVPANQTDTVVFDAGGFGNDTIVHFDDGATGDVLDFSAWLNNQYDISNLTPTVGDSANPIAITLNGDANVEANSVTVLQYTTSATQTWAGLNGDTLKAAINSTNTGTNNYSNINENTLEALNTYTATQLIGGTGHAIVMIENQGNLGEYKVFELSFNGTLTNTALDFADVRLVGTVDFGEHQTFTVENFDIA